MPNKENTNNSLYNQNCYAYLRQVMEKMPKRILDILPENIRSDLKKQCEGNYNSKFPYGRLYTAFLKRLEDNIEDIYYSQRKELIQETKVAAARKNMNLSLLGSALEKHILGEEDRKKSEIQKLDDFINTIYVNDNEILERSFEVIKDITSEVRPGKDHHIQKEIARLIGGDDKNTLNSTSPTAQGSNLGRFSAMIADDFKPMHTTSFPTVRHFPYQAENDPVEVRFGTQAQRHKGEERVSPLFECWLEVQQEKQGEHKRITHVYFNNLGLDRTGFEGEKEKNLSLALHSLEAHHRNIIVITLPADKGLMGESDFKKTDKNLIKTEVFNDFLGIASQNPQSNIEIKDFYLSDTAKQLLYGAENTAEEETSKLTELLEESFRAMGLSESDIMSESERQAVWMHFTKYTFPDFVLKTLNPETFNFSCKDAIDRGGVSSAYYNLMKSFEEGNTPMTRDEFDKTLHAAPTAVKGRGMNSHLKRIWNAVDAFVNASHDDLKSDSNKKWLIAWRDANCPHVRVESLLNSRLVDAKAQLNAEKALILDNQDSKLEKINLGLEILEHIENQSNEGVNGKRLLLESVTRTLDLVLSDKPDQKSLESYQKLAEDMPVRSPTLKTVAGLMLRLIGSLIRSESLFNKGVELSRTGEHSSERETIKQKMEALVNPPTNDSLGEDDTPKGPRCI